MNRAMNLVLAAALLSPVPALCQSCPSGPVDVARLTAVVNKAAREFRLYDPDDSDTYSHWVDEGIIYRAAAIAGEPLMPTLRRASRPGMAPDTIPGAAQVSLAKLGDHVAFSEIAMELELGNGAGYPGTKLGMVGNREAVRTLLRYFFAHAADRNRYHNSGDYGSDDMDAVLVPLLKIVRNPPAPGVSTTGGAKEWAAWWDQNRSNPLAFSFSSQIADPYTQCLARKIEWGFPDAILDLGTHGNRQALPAIRALAQMGDTRIRAERFDSIPGRAQAALAKLGDEDEFAAIVAELESPSTDDAVRKLQYIGGRKAAVALLDSLADVKFLADFPDWRLDGDHAPGVIFDHDEAIENALIKMVINPPDTTGEQRNKFKWLDWWASHKDTVQFASPPSATHE